MDPGFIIEDIFECLLSDHVTRLGVVMSVVNCL